MGFSGWPWYKGDVSWWVFLWYLWLAIFLSHLLTTILLDNYRSGKGKWCKYVIDCDQDCNKLGYKIKMIGEQMGESALTLQPATPKAPKARYSFNYQGHSLSSSTLREPFISISIQKLLSYPRNPGMLNKIRAKLRRNQWWSFLLLKKWLENACRTLQNID